MPYKECFIQDSSCVDKFKQAHILSQSATMKLVHGPTSGGLNVIHLGNKNQQGNYEPRPIGWTKASAYHCFCHDHDNDLFLPIENDRKLNPENVHQLFLHVMRSFSYVYYRKKEQMQFHDDLVKEFHEIGDSLEKLQHFLAQFIVLPPRELSKEQALKYNLSLSFWSFQYVRNELLKILNSKKFENLVYRTLIFPERLPFASAGVLLARDIEPQSKKITVVSINPGDPVVKSPALMFNVLPDKFDRTIIIAAALKDDYNAVHLLKKLDELSQPEFCKALTRLMFDANKENTFLHPQFWEFLKNNGYASTICKELNEDRGYDSMLDSMKLSDLNLFDPKFSCKAIGID